MIFVVNVGGLRPTKGVPLSLLRELSTIGLTNGLLFAPIKAD